MLVLHQSMLQWMKHRRVRLQNPLWKISCHISSWICWVGNSKFMISFVSCSAISGKMKSSGEHSSPVPDSTGINLEVLELWTCFLFDCAFLIQPKQVLPPLYDQVLTKHSSKPICMENGCPHKSVPGKSAIITGNTSFLWHYKGHLHCTQPRCFFVAKSQDVFDAHLNDFHESLEIPEVVCQTNSNYNEISCLPGLCLLRQRLRVQTDKLPIFRSHSSFSLFGSWLQSSVC